MMAKASKKTKSTKTTRSTERRGAPTRSPRISETAVIRVVGDNPRRPGTDAHLHFEKMKGGVTVGAYLKKFKSDRRKIARQWLTNTVRDGHAKILGS